MTQSTASATKQRYDYFLVLDFEATCDDKRQIRPQEVIEFPIVVVDAVTLENVAEFHYYIKPDAL